MVKNEWIKLCGNRILLLFTILMLLFNGLYYKWTLDVRADVTKPAASEYNRMAQELAVLSDEEKRTFLLDGLAEMSAREELQMQVIQAPGISSFYNSDIDYFLLSVLYEEMEEELDRVIGYHDQVSAIIRNADAQMRRLENGNYGALERRFMKSRLEKTREIYEGLLDVEPAFYPSRGIRAFVDNPVTDCCCLFILLFAVFFILTAERQNELIILSKTTRRGRGAHGTAKAAALTILCAVVTVLMITESILVIGSIYPFAPFTHPVQSVFPYCALRINLLEYVCIYAVIRMLFYLMCTAVFYFVCCLFHKVIPVFLVIAGTVGLLSCLYIRISETSWLAPLRTMNPIAFGQAGALLERYQCVNVFGLAVNKSVWYPCLCGVLAFAFFAAGIRVFAVSYEKHAVSDRFSFLAEKKKCHVGIIRHECYKAFIAQKIIFVLMFAGLFASSFDTFFGVNGFSLTELFYDHYSEEVKGPYTEKIDAFIRQNQEIVSAQMAQPGVEEPQRIMYQAQREALTWMSEYEQYLSTHKGSYYLFNPGFTALTGGNDELNRQNIMISMALYAFAAVCFVLTMSIDYQHGENRLIHSNVKGRKAYVCSKLLIGMMIAAVLCGMFWLPQIMGTLQSWGTEFMFAPAYSLQHLDGIWGGISIFTYICLRYMGKYLMLLGIMLLSYLIERRVKSSVEAIVWVCAIVEIPLVVMLLN